MTKTDAYDMVQAASITHKIIFKDHSEKLQIPVQIADEEERESSVWHRM